MSNNLTRLERSKKTRNRQNPKNPANKLFQKLTRFFSGPISRYKTQFPHKEKRRNLSKYNFKSASGLAFTKNQYSPFNVMNARSLAEAGRVERYQDFEQMEYEPLIHRALDVYADEITSCSTMEQLLKIECKNEEIELILKDFFYNTLAIESNLFPWTRETCKAGDFFLYLDITEENGIERVLALPVAEVERLEGEDESNPDYVQFQWNTGGITFEAWQIAHFRILGNINKFGHYGESVLEGARRIWRQLTLLEDAMMAYRIVRSAERRIFYLWVGGIDPQNVEQHVEDVATEFKRNSIADPETGRVDLRYNPMSIEEDFFIPVRPGDQGHTKVDTLKGGQFVGDIEDVQYLKDKLHTALKIPQSYLTGGEGAEDEKTTLAQKNITFANTIMRLQRHIIDSLYHIARVHLFVLGYKDNDLLNFKISLNNPSKLAHMQELETLRMKIDLANQAYESGFFSRRYIAEKVLQMSDKDYERCQIEKFYDAKYDARLESMLGQAEEGMGGEFGGELGELPDTEDIADAEMAANPPDEEPAEEGALLAAPGKRDEYTTPGAKGKMYKKRPTDTRDMGARRRSWQGSYHKELSKGTKRNVRHGKSTMASLSNIFEEREAEMQRLEEKYKELNKFTYTGPIDKSVSKIFQNDNLTRGVEDQALDLIIETIEEEDEI